MRKTVHSKLIACYILIGIIGFFLPQQEDHILWNPIWKVR